MPDSGWLTLLKDTSPIAIGVIAVLAILGFLWLRKAGHADMRENLGLLENETLDQKINAAVQSGFTASVHPLTEALAHQTSALAEIKTELRGVRVGLTNHGEKISILEIEVASLTTQVGGPTAVHALRSRLERRRAEAVARLAEENGK